MIQELPAEISALLSGTGLSILAKNVTDGFMVGRHRGTRRGTGSEFSQYRSYEPGDDIRRIDWKMFARSDRYYIKEAEIETSVTIRFFLDASLSMMYHENKVSRYNYAALVVASLATLAHMQGDGIALHVVNDKRRLDLQPGRGKNQINRFYNLLENVDCRGQWPADANWLTECSTRNRELWITCSDMLDGAGMWESFRNMGEAFGHELLFLQVLGEKELNFGQEGVMTLKDPESLQERTIRTQAVRDQYLENLNRYLEELKASVKGRKSEIDLIAMNQPVMDSLRRYLERREEI